ncbi:arogenate dehydrogenase 1, chloroplastic-like isoform X2 [Punica granatum]|uniref:Arogenate dehydrogenase 1, chloroplastic-like isoform X2 n=1 Tax=Punica granatum TaxID=22663 RepID=A0A6P8BZF8_PUNGR|nr:arogenate dehydrogenase 1, chloroplastic-like isoform X2 [Punica granatum]XP_031374996.1 arogenate dehydrogenase 1, chloroplastic-like isoform X2 [Punica granatum]
MSSSSTTTNSPSRALRIGIIGFGPFAQFLLKTKTKQCHQLQATSRTDHSRLCARMGIAFFSDVGEFLESGNDVIMICKSILSPSEVLKTIPFHRLRRPNLFVDALSVKEYPRASLLQVVPEDSDILCTHPMFGPESGKDGWEGLNFMYERVRVRDHETCSSCLQIFKKEALNLGNHWKHLRDAGCLKCPARNSISSQLGANSSPTQSAGSWQKWMSTQQI